MEIQVYHTLPEAARQIRQEVCRVFQGREPGEYLVGRIAVRKSFRGQNLGAALLEAAEQEIWKAGGSSVRLHAQQRASGFYEKQGYEPYGPVEYEEYCPHIWMKKKLL